MIFLQPPPNLEAALVLNLLLTLIFQVYSVIGTRARIIFESKLYSC